MNEDLMTRGKELLANTLDRLPQVLTALAVVLGGWVLASLLRTWSRRLMRRAVARLAQNPSVARGLEGTQVDSLLPTVVGGFLFWTVLLLSLAAAVEMLGLPIATTTVSRFAYYLPNVLAGVVIVLGGVLLGNFVRGIVSRAAEKAGVAYAPSLGRVAQVAVVIVAVVVAIEEIGIEGRLLVTLVAIGVGSIVASIGLAFGLGARTAVSNIIAAHYVAQTYRVGQTVRVGAVQGRILAIGPTAVTLEGAEGEVTIPAQQFGEEVSVLLSEPG
jgi:small-conductance mechanosensitive channel